jgi:hypothetical protein
MSGTCSRGAWLLLGLAETFDATSRQEVRD